MWREMSEEERRQRWRRGGWRGDKGGGEEWSTWHKDARVQTIQHTNKAPNITTERLKETRWHTQTCSLHLTSDFRRPTSSDSTSSFRSLHHIVWNKYTAGFLHLTNRILPPPLCQLTPSSSRSSSRILLPPSPPQILIRVSPDLVYETTRSPD